jgi:hypothetical protein
MRKAGATSKLLGLERLAIVLALVGLRLGLLLGSREVEFVLGRILLLLVLLAVVTEVEAFEALRERR